MAGRPACHRASRRPHLQVIEDYELTDTQEQRDTDLAAASREPADDEPAAEPAPDIRTEATADTEPADDDSMRVPIADETAAAVRRAQQALVELRERRTAEEKHQADEQAQEDDDLARWHVHDANTDEPSTDNQSAADHRDGAALELSPIRN